MNSETSNSSHWLHVTQKLPILLCQSSVLICGLVRFFSLQNVILVLQSTFTSANSGCFCCHALVGQRGLPLYRALSLQPKLPPFLISLVLIIIILQESLGLLAAHRVAFSADIQGVEISACRQPVIESNHQMSFVLTLVYTYKNWCKTKVMINLFIAGICLNKKTTERLQPSFH